MKDINIADVGALGLDLVSSPLHTPPGTLLEAQNVEYVRERGLGGLGSRGALRPFNTVALAGSVMALAGIPLPSAVDTTIQEGILLGTPTGFLVSANGTTYSALTNALHPVSLVADTFPRQTQRMIRVTDSLFYPGVFASVTAGETPLIAFTNGSPAIVDSIPGHLMAMTTLGGKVYMAVADAATTFDATTIPLTGRVIEYDPNLGSHVTIGEEFGIGFIDQDVLGGDAGVYGFAPSSVFVDTGRLYVVVGASSQGVITNVINHAVFSIDPSSEVVWTLERLAAQYTNGAGLGTPDPGQGIAPFGLPAIYVGSAQLAGNQPSTLGGTVIDDKAYIARADGATLDAFVSPDANPGTAWFGPLIAFDSKVFAAYASSDGLGDAVDGKVYVRDNDVDVNPMDFTLDKDVVGDFLGNVFPGQPFLLGTDLYWPWFGAPGTVNEGYILQRTTGGVWTQVATGLDLSGLAAAAKVPV